VFFSSVLNSFYPGRIATTQRSLRLVYILLPQTKTSLCSSHATYSYFASIGGLQPIETSLKLFVATASGSMVASSVTLDFDCSSYWSPASLLSRPRVSTK